MAQKNSNLHAAKAAKNDEFYTRLEDIENELKHYKSFFKGKTVYCNCDDPKESNFFKFFSMNFENYGLKKLITTGYNENGHGYLYIYEGDRNGNRMVDDSEIRVVELQGDGDFRSEECIQYLKESDVVVTNEPFSLFREYFTQLMIYNKKFLIIGNMNAITYKEVFPYIKNNQVWLGNNYVKEFVQPDGSIKKFGNILWYTNIPHKKRNQPLDLYSKYNPIDYPKFENYNAINVNKVNEIPEDYNGIMGVPSSFLSKYCPEQFEILGMCENLDLYSLKTKVYSSNECKAAYYRKFGKQGIYDLNASGVLLINGQLEKVYQRILIRKITK